MKEASSELAKIQTEKYKLDSRISNYTTILKRVTTDEEKNNIIELHKQSVHELPDLLIRQFEKVRIHEKYRDLFWRYNDIYEDRVSNKTVEKKEFIMKCVKDSCRGFLSQAYKCELCNTYVCKDCMIVNDYSTIQRKSLYDMLVENGFSREYLQTYSTAFLLKK